VSLMRDLTYPSKTEKSDNMEAIETVIDSVKIGNDTVTLSKVIGGNVVGHSEKYTVSYEFEGGIGELNYPRTVEGWDTARDKYLQFFEAIINKSRFGKEV
jgi:hypothetical protein